MPPLPGLMVQPIAIDYGAAAEQIASVGYEPVKANAGRIFSRQGSLPVTLHFPEPVDPHDIPARKSLHDVTPPDILPALGASSGWRHALYALWCTFETPIPPPSTPP